MQQLKERPVRHYQVYKQAEGAQWSSGIIKDSSKQRMEVGEGEDGGGERIVQNSFAVTLLYIPPATPIPSAFP